MTGEMFGVESPYQEQLWFQIIDWITFGSPMKRKEARDITKKFVGVMSKVPGLQIASLPWRVALTAFDLMYDENGKKRKKIDNGLIKQLRRELTQ